MNEAEEPDGAAREDAASARLSCEAHAKTNLCLYVLGKREDGYHELFTVFDELELADRLSFEPGPTPWSLEIRFAEGPRGLPVEAGEGNLVLRAARAFAEAFGLEGGGRFALEKRIPAGAGLGGGSSDAAAALRLLAGHHGIETSDARLLSVAESLGADVPFFLVGDRAYAGGRGDRIHALPPEPRLFYVLLFPGYPCPTSLVFGNWVPTLTDPETLLDSRNPSGFDPGVASHSESSHRDLALQIVAVLQKESIGRNGAGARLLSNHLEDAARSAVPRLGRLHERLLEDGLRDFRLSGSGSTLYFVTRDEGEASSTKRRVDRLLDRLESEDCDSIGEGRAVFLTRSHLRDESSGS